MGVMEWSNLHAAIVDQFGMAAVEPAILDGLAVQIRSRVGCGERNLDRVRIDFRSKTDRFLDRFLGFGKKADEERHVDSNSEVVALLGKAAGNIDPHTLLDVVEYL